jgi:replicative superfamily II helicase
MAWKARSKVSPLYSDILNDNVQLDLTLLENASSEDDYADLSSNSIVVLDEFHYMGEKGRGSTWEESVIFNPASTQIVG